MARIVLDTGPGDGSSLARLLRDAGHEIVLLAGTDADTIAGVAVQEDADVVIAYDAPRTRLGDLTTALAEKGAADVPAYVADPADLASALGWVASYDR